MQSTNSQREETKVEINNCFDLYNLPLSKLKSTKLYNFSGKYFDKIYQEALKLENEELEKQNFTIKPNQLKIKQIEFEIFYLTEVK